MFSINYDNWDSIKLSIKVGKINFDTSSNDLNQIDDFDLLVSKIDINDIKKIQLIEKLGFKKICSEYLLKRRNLEIKVSESKDIKTKINNIKKIKIDGFSMKYSRFSLDKKIYNMIDPNFWNELILEHIREYADKSFMSINENNHLQGIITCKFHDKIINMMHVNVSENYRFRGIGKKLIENVISYADRKKLDLTTQVISKNKKAINFYGNYGFEKIKTDTVFHRWRQQ